MKNSRQTTLWLAMLVALGTAQARQTDAPAPASKSASVAALVTVDIPAQAMSQALDLFARQTGLQVVFSTEEVAPGLQAPELSGTYTPEAVLGKLLANSGLRFEFINARTVAIVGKSTAPVGGRAFGTGMQEDGLVLARVAGDPGRSMGVAHAEDTRSAREVSKDSAGTPEILVKGNRSLNTDIRRTEDDVQPYVVFDARTIGRSMASSIEDFLKTRLPMNTVSSTSSQQAELTGNTSTIDLRGLGTDETLVLVNGRRLPGVSALNRGGSIAQADINGIPIAAVERIEVLPSTASGIYGGGATGGVVNIILKSDYSATDLSVVYDNSFDTDSGTRRIDATSGFSLNSGATSVMMFGSYSDANGMLVRDRDFVDRAYALYLKNTQDNFSTAFRPPLASTTNIRLQAGDTQLRLKNPNGGAPIPLGARIAHIPRGYAGVQSDNGAALLATAGRYNTELPLDIQGMAGGMVNSPTVASFGVNLRQRISARLDGFVDLSRSRNEGHVQDASQSSSFTLLPQDPGNPFDNRVQFSYPLPGLAFDRSFTSENRVMNAGLIMQLPHRWIGQTEYSWSRSRSGGESTSPILSADARDAIRSGELNVFRDLNVHVPDYSAYLLDSPNNFTGPFDNTATGITARLAGPAHDLPGGPLTLSAFFEHRKSAADAAFSRQQDFFDRSYSMQYYAARSEVVDSISMEVTAPLISQRNVRPGFNALQLQAAVRYDAYEVNGVETEAQFLMEGDPVPELDRRTTTLSSADYTVGARYAPSQDIALRASFGTGFLPPSVAQITPTIQIQDLFIADPQRGGVSNNVPDVLQTSGGNPDLDAEQSTSLSLGMVFTPRFLEGLRLTVDFTEIRKQGEISSISPSSMLANEAFFAGRITRGPLTQDDRDNGYTAGPITSLDYTYINLAETKVRGFDVQFDYTVNTPAGKLRAYALATHLQDYVYRFQPDTPEYDNAGHTGQLKWRGNAGLTLERNGWSLDWNVQYFDTYLLYPANVPAGARPSYYLSQGEPSIPRQHYHDVTAWLRLGELYGSAGFLANTDMQLGVRNIFNTSPPIVATSLPSNGYSFYGDPRMRRYFISLSKHFQ